MKLAQKVNQWCGTVFFLLLNAGAFTVWIVINGAGIVKFDPYPYQFLTLAVSLEAIFLSIFVLITQNKQIEEDRKTIENDAEVNKKTLQEMHILHDKLVSLLQKEKPV